MTSPPPFFVRCQSKLIASLAVTGFVTGTILPASHRFLPKFLNSSTLALLLVRHDDGGMVSFHIHGAWATEANGMGEESMWITMAIFGIGSMVFFAIGMIAGFFIGYRHGTVAGELAALKSKLRRSDHDQYRRISKRTHDEAEPQQSGSP